MDNYQLKTAKRHWCDETPHCAHRTTSRRERRATGRFAPS